ncbi:RNA polymerase sigma-70 factor [Opitutus sp. ER46]|uniref:RNA polymerase sigma-70 factor n=1 Tax=Opitutus sp. ER46 TaxID=2161864 RepID=UPI000D31D888|nr:RNA polymerase sigma-70 factor [Opitutus sp. ER46]PTX95667.1 RNA polymerase sigma-70 factor [Opitutus sp. ER46]
MEDPFVALRPRLFGIAYRMLGSVADAEDAVQEAYLRWQAQDRAVVTSATAWLVSATTRLCIDRLRSAQRRREEYVGVWLPEPLLHDAAADPAEPAALADSLSMAFMLMLESLAPVERAVLLLREAFDYDYAEIAGIVGRSEAACRQIVSRSRRSLAGGAGRTATLPEKAEQLTHRFLGATQTGDLRELLALLTDDVVLIADGGGKANAVIRPVRTADRVARFFVGIRRFATAAPQVTYVLVNGRPGAVVRVGGKVDRVVSLDFDGDRVRAIYIVRNPDKLVRCRPPGADGS